MSLRPSQLQRAAALDRARHALGARTVAGLVESRVDALDLVRVAQFILDGRDPWTLPVGVLVENDEQKGISS